MGITKILIDNCVDSLSDLMEPARKPFKLKWGTQEIEQYVAGYMRKEPRGSNEVWMQQQIECLPTIARLGRESRLSFWTYHELTMEAIHRPKGFPANLIGNLFEGIEYSHMDTPIERSRIFSNDLSFHADSSAMIEFCRFLINLDVSKFFSKPDLCKRFPANELENIRNVGRFRDLCKGLSESQYRDAFHLWSAEVNGIDCFLTTDRKFKRVMTETKKINLPCKVVSPSDLLDELSVTERDEFPYRQNQFYNICGVPS